MDTENINLENRKKILIDLLNVFLDYCKKNNLNAYLSSGTLLGAVRHSGFIPWDDDIDLMMPIDDYNKLKELMISNPIEKPYYFSSELNNRNHMWPFIKMINQKTCLIEPMLMKKLKKSQEEFYGVYIDIFPIYGLPNEEKDRIKFQKELNNLYEKFRRSTRVMNKRPNDSNFIYGLRYVLYDIYCLPNRIMGMKYYIKKMNYLINKYPINDSKKVGFTMGIITGGKDHIASSFLKNTSTLNFEGIKSPVLSEYDKILKNQYGDYMKLPPENERHFHPSNARWRGDE